MGDAVPLVMRRRIAAPREIVFTHLVEPERLIGWFGVSGDVAPTVGGGIRIDVTGGDVMIGEFLAIEPPSLVRFSWGWEGNTEVPPASTIVTFELAADGDETELTLTHDGLPAGADDNHAVGWTYFLERLRSTSEGRTVGPVDLAELGSITPVLEDRP